jgi:hypothetical protein
MKNVAYCIMAILFFSCQKDKTGVQIRIKNNTNSNFNNAENNSVSFGSISTNATTSYKYFDKVVAYPGATIFINTDTAYAGIIGYCGTPPIPYLEPGKYTLLIEDINPAQPFRKFDAKYIKD